MAAIFKNGYHGHHIENLQWPDIKSFWTVFGYKFTKCHAFITKCTILWNCAVKLPHYWLLADSGSYHVDQCALSGAKKKILGDHSKFQNGGCFFKMAAGVFAFANLLITFFCLTYFR